MANLEINLFPSNLKPNKRAQRRFSTGNSILKIDEQRPIPNYLRASIGSCHDLCKYGATPKQHKTAVRGRKASDTKNSVPVPSRSIAGRGLRSPGNNTTKSSNIRRNPSLEVNVPEKIIHVVEDHNPNGRAKAENGVACRRKAVSDGEINVVGGEVTEQEKSKPHSVVEPKQGKGKGKMSRNKVKALVDAFETLINIQDSPSSTRLCG